MAKIYKKIWNANIAKALLQIRLELCAIRCKEKMKRDEWGEGERGRGEGKGGGGMDYLVCLPSMKNISYEGISCAAWSRKC